MVIVAIGLDILIRVEIKEVIYTQGQRGLRSKVVRYREVGDDLAMKDLVTALVKLKIAYTLVSGYDIRACSLSLISIAQVAAPFAYGKVLGKGSLKARDYLFQKYARAFGEEFVF